MGDHRHRKMAWPVLAIRKFCELPPVCISVTFDGDGDETGRLSYASVCCLNLNAQICLGV